MTRQRMKITTFTKCSTALQALSGAERALQTLVTGSQWEDDPRVLAFWMTAEDIVNVLREAHADAVSRHAMDGTSEQGC